MTNEFSRTPKARALGVLYLKARALGVLYLKARALGVFYSISSNFRDATYISRPTDKPAVRGFDVLQNVCTEVLLHTDKDKRKL